MKDFISSIANNTNNLASSEPFRWNTIEATNAYVKGNAAVLVSETSGEIITFLYKTRFSSYLESVTDLIKRKL